MSSQYTRKLLKMGDASIGVVIPKAWLKYKNLGKGDEVKVVTNSNVIVKVGNND